MILLTVSGFSRRWAQNGHEIRTLQILVFLQSGKFNFFQPRKGKKSPSSEHFRGFSELLYDTLVNVSGSKWHHCGNSSCQHSLCIETRRTDSTIMHRNTWLYKFHNKKTISSLLIIIPLLFFLNCYK